MSPRPPPLAARASSSRSMADESPAGAGVLDSTRELAAQALERAAEKMRELRHGVTDSAIAAQRQVHRYADATSRTIAEQPLKSALVAAALGALVMAIVLRARARRPRY